MDCYTYKPLALGHTRLLELLPDSSKLVGRISHFSIRTERVGADCRIAPPYNALSHHWDPRPRDERQLPPIFIEDEDAIFILPLRPNLYSALIALRDKAIFSGWRHHLWVDAICIDQRSSYDKLTQIPRVGQIYNSAERVIVWVGGLDHDTSKAFSFIRKLQEPQSLRKYFCHNIFVEEWSALAEVMRKACFTRRWLVQEIAAARDIVILAGPESIPWLDFSSAVSVFISQCSAINSALAKTGIPVSERGFLSEIELSGANVLVMLRDRLLRRNAKGEIVEHLATLEVLLTSLSMFQVTKPHDAIFAYLWLSADMHETQPKNLSSRLGIHRVRSQALMKENNLLGPNACPGSDTTVETSFDDHTIDHTLQHPRQTPSLSCETTSRPTCFTFDYDQSVFSLCKSVFEHIISLSERLDIICFPWAPPPSKSAKLFTSAQSAMEGPHPTWMPQARYETYAHPGTAEASNSKTLRREHADALVGIPGSCSAPYRACGQTYADGVRIDGRILSTQGYILTSIATLSEVAKDAIILCDWRHLLGWHDLVMSPPDVFWRILVADKGHYGSPAPPRFRLACKWAFQQYEKCDSLDLGDVRRTGEAQAAVSEYIERAIATVWNRRVFSGTSSNPNGVLPHVGLGPADMMMGDVIAILHGCSVPVVLRPQTLQSHDVENTAKTRTHHGETQRSSSIPEMPSTYSLVGECFLYNQMHGEHIRTVQKRGIAAGEIHLL